MARNVPAQTYLPPHIADWVGDEAARMKLNKSFWVGTMIIDLHWSRKYLTRQERMHVMFASN